MSGPDETEMMSIWEYNELSQARERLNETVAVMGESHTFELKVSKAGMPDCPLCGKPVQEGDRPMVFRAHGLAALAHDACRPEGE